MQILFSSLNKWLPERPRPEVVVVQHRAPAIAMQGITKRFGNLLANNAVDFVANRGEVHALVGENGAGKSTLMSILTGMYRPDSGALAIDGEPVRFTSPRDAIDHSIGMVHQHFMLVEPFTVTENVLLGARGRSVGLNTAEVERDLQQLGERYGLQVNPRAPVWQLGVGEQQRVEILRLLYFEAEILIFDEPTAVLTPGESTALLGTLREMAASGFAIVFISHKLDEVLTVADRITVMRHGVVTGSVLPAETDRRALARMMVGRDLASFVEHPEHEPHPGVEPGPVVLELRGLRTTGDNGREALHGVDLIVRAGETLGIAGVSGNGQRELAEVVTGLRPVTGGSLVMNGKDLTGRGPGEIARAGVAHIPEDRLADGLAGSLDVSMNAILRDYGRPPLASGPFLQPGPIGKFTSTLIQQYDVKTTGPGAKTASMSGGNQQKLLIGRELVGSPKLIVAVHPARGVDAGSTEAIHVTLRERREHGAGLLLISEDLDELLALSDRIAVMFAGRIVGAVSARNASREQIGLMMTGVVSGRASVRG